MVQIKPILLFRNLRNAQAVCNSFSDCGGVSYLGMIRSARKYALREGTTIKKSHVGGIGIFNPHVAYVKHCRATQRAIRRPTTCQYTHRYNVYLSGYPRSTGKRRYRSVKKCIGTSLDRNYEFWIPLIKTSALTRMPGKCATNTVIVVVSPWINKVDIGDGSSEEDELFTDLLFVKDRT